MRFCTRAAEQPQGSLKNESRVSLLCSYPPVTSHGTLSNVQAPGWPVTSCTTRPAGLPGTATGPSSLSPVTLDLFLLLTPHRPPGLCSSLGLEPLLPLPHPPFHDRLLLRSEVKSQPLRDLPTLHPKVLPHLLLLHCPVLMISPCVPSSFFK